MSATISTIEQYYTNILQRPADSSGLSYFTNQVANGTSLSAVETEIATSTEATTYVDPIVRLYEGIFGRAPDAAGLGYWVSEEESGALTVAQIANLFVTSAEGQAVLGTSLSATAVETLYENSLGRTPSSSEIASWLNSGLTLSQVAYDISESPEAQEHQASATLSYLLNAGENLPPTTGNLININASALTYTGTTGNDTFYATNGADLITGTTLNGDGGNDTLLISNYDAATGLYYQGIPLAQLLGTGVTIEPTLNGISNIEITASPGQGNNIVDLILSTDVTTAELTDSSNSGFQFTDASTLASATLSNSSGSYLGIVAGISGSPLATVTISDSQEGTLNVSGGNTPVATATISDSPSATLNLESETAPALTINVTASPTAVGSGRNTSVNIASVTGDQLADLTLNIASTTAATLQTPDQLFINDSNPATASGNAGFQTLTINSTGAEWVADSYAGGNPDGLANTNNVEVASGSGSLYLDVGFSDLQTFSSTGYTGELEAPSSDAAAAALLATAAGTSLPASYAGIEVSGAGLIVTNGDKLTTISTGSGNSVVNLSDDLTLKNVTVTFGSGDDILFLGSSTATGSTFNGGGGTNTIGIQNGSLTTAVGNTFANFADLEIGPNNGSGIGGTGTYNLAAFTGSALTAVSLTGIDSAASALSGNVILNNAPNALAVVETAYPGLDLSSSLYSLTVDLGAVTPVNGVYNHSTAFVLNADDTPTDTSANGTVTTGTLAVGYVGGDADTSASFVPGAYTEAVSLASNIATPASTLIPADYTNTVDDLSIAQATSLAITNQASLDVAAVTAGALQSITIGGGTGNVTLGGLLTANGLTSVNASGSTGAVTLDVGSVTGFTYDGSSGADDVTVAGTGGNTFTGNGGNDTFNVAGDATTAMKPDTFAYNAPTDANVMDTNPNGIFLNDLGTTLSIETINGFDQANDVINLSGFAGNGSARVLLDNGAGPITGATNLTSVSDLFSGAAGQLALNTPGSAAISAAQVGGLYGAFLYQDGADNVEVFVAAGTGTSSFAAGSDLAINLFSAGGLSEQTVAHDLKFA